MTIKPMRRTLIEGIAAEILARPVATRALKVAIDGVDGAGKTYLADELAAVLEGSGRQVIRASVDGFHHPREIRYRKGRSSPDGFFEDSYDYDRLRSMLLDPLGSGGNGRFQRAAFDHVTDSPIIATHEEAAVDAILLLDGIFLHRDELAGYWDYSIFLDVDFAVSIPRGASRGDASPDPAAETNRRYVEGQRIYLMKCSPLQRATVVIDNNDLERPFRKQPNSSAK